MEKNSIPQERVIAAAKAQIGYFGKKTNANLDDFKANAGGKFNKYARDLDALGDFYNGRKNGYDWCDVFVDWCFVQTFGREVGQRLLCQPDRSCGAGTKYSMNYYKARGRFFTAPQPGDQIFFGDAKSVWHTGLVTAVGGGYVSTVEGNAGSPSAVRQCRYVIGGKNILGYGRPDWSIVPADKPAQEAKPAAPAEAGKEENAMNEEQIRKIVREEWDRLEAERATRPASRWAEKELALAKLEGITDGQRPRSFVTREEAAVMVYRAKGD